MFVSVSTERYQVQISATGRSSPRRILPGFFSFSVTKCNNNPLHLQWVGRRGCGSVSSVGTATVYGLDVPMIESPWGRDFPPVQTGPGAHPASCKMDTGSFPGVKCGWGVLLTPHPLLAPRSWKSRAIPLPTVWVPNGPVTGLLYFFKIEEAGLNNHI